MSGGPAASRRLPWDELTSISPLRAASPEDAVCGRMPQQVIEPRTAEEIAAILKWANSKDAAVAIRGGGTKMDWGNPPRALDLVLSTRAMNRILEHAWEDLTVTAQPGCTVAELQRAVAQHGQRMAIDPMFAEQATIGGILATNDSGSLRTRFGSLRDLIIGIKVALPDGTLARSGGKVVKNVAGYDLAKLFTGALGTLGVITETVFRLHPLPSQSRTLNFRCASVPDASRSLLALQDSILVHTGLQIRITEDGSVFMDVRFEGIAAGVETQAERSLALVQGSKSGEEQNVWSFTESFWANSGTASICHISLLPTQIAGTCDQIRQLSTEFKLHWQAALQAVGVGRLRLDGDVEQQGKVILKLRERFEHRGGSLVVLRCPDSLRGRIDAWGSVGSALPLMYRVKEQFDPAGILNPGRFVGGI